MGSIIMKRSVLYGAKKKLVITLQIPYNENTEDDVIRYCHEIVDEMKISPDFVKS